MCAGVAHASKQSDAGRVGVEFKSHNETVLKKDRRVLVLDRAKQASWQSQRIASHGLS